MRSRSGEGKEGRSEGFVVVDAVEGGVVVSECVSDGDAVFEGFDVEGRRLVRVAGGDDLPISDGSTRSRRRARGWWVRGRGVG